MHASMCSACALHMFAHVQAVYGHIRVTCVVNLMV